MKKKIPALLILAALIIVSCKEKHGNKNYIPVPSFEIKVDLDEKAEKELRARKETIKVSLLISGIPRKDSGISENNKASGLILGSAEKELVSKGVVRFEGLTIPENLYQALENKDYGVSVSVRSGWKSSKYNLLNCEPFGNGISELAGKQHIIKCKLRGSE